MEIFLVRHGEAVPQSEWGKGDGTRPLTDGGRDKLESALPFIRRFGVRPAWVLTSPLVRAKETAEILCRLADDHLVPEPVPALGSGAMAESFRRVLVERKDRAPILIVGHIPDLPGFASRLTQSAALLETTFRPGEMMALDTGPIENAWGHGRLLWRRTLDDWISESPPA